MAWIESHQALREHPKTKRLARTLGIDRYAAIGLLHCLWWWTLDYADDGDLSRFDEHDIADGVDWDGDAAHLVKALTCCGFIDSDRHIHDWEDFAGRIKARREQSKDRQRRFRERGGSAPDSGNGVTSHESNADVTRDSRVSNGSTNQPDQPDQPDRTQPTRARGRAKSAGADSESPSPVPKPNRSAEFVDAVKALEPDAPVALSDRDGAAIKRSAVKPERLAQAYVAAFRGEWGNDWLRDNLSVHLVVDRYAGFETHLRAPPKAPPRSRNGQTAVPLQTLDDQRRHYATSLNGKEQPAS